MPTTAPYKEAGDVVPMFTRDMFVNSQAGALAAAKYYFDARDWALATVNAASIAMICDATKCLSDASYFDSTRRSGQHFKGLRQHPGAQKLISAGVGHNARWLAQFKINIDSGSLIDRGGSVIRKQKATAQLVDLSLSWTGKMWRVVEDVLAP